MNKKFLETVKDHKLTIEIDDGFNRSILCKPDNSYIRYFRVVTYKGGLLITGDMGSWCFERLPDMFEFFGGKSEINYHYWAEKLVCYDAKNEPYEFDDELFNKEVMERFKEYFKDECEGDPEFLLGFKECLDVSEYTDLSFYRINKVSEFLDNHGLCSGFMESVYNSGRKQNSRLEWCMNAIVWCIQEYNNIKKI